MNSVSRTDKGGKKTYGRLVVQREDVVYISLDNARLARANVADDEDLVQVLLDFTGVALFFPLGRVDFFFRSLDVRQPKGGVPFFFPWQSARGGWIESPSKVRQRKS